MKFLIENEMFVVFDMEYTAWKGSLERNWAGKGKHPEIIQLGAVKLARYGDLTKIDCLDLYVKPRFNTNLSDYITDFTEITNEMIAECGVSFWAALMRFTAFCEKTRDIYSFGNDERMLVRDCDLNGVDLPLQFDRFRDLETPLKEALALAPKTASSDLVDIL